MPSEPGLGVYVTEQLPATSVQVDEPKLPEPLVVKVTVPVGVMAVPDEMSVTVTVQVVGAFAESGEIQLMLAEVERLVTERAKVPVPVV